MDKEEEGGEKGETWAEATGGLIYDLEMHVIGKRGEGPVRRARPGCESPTRARVDQRFQRRLVGLGEAVTRYAFLWQPNRYAHAHDPCCIPDRLPSLALKPGSRTALF
jgi:hypothetical protein